VLAVVERLHRARAEVAGLALEGLGVAELLGLLDDLERDRRCAPSAEHRILAELQSRVEPKALGAKNWAEVLRVRLRISAADAHRRCQDAAALGPRTAMTGEPLAPVMPHVAARQAVGQIGADHLRVITGFFTQLPAAVDYQTREGCERTLARAAAELDPGGLRAVANRLAGWVNPDGEFSDTDRARRRGLHLGPQGPDGLSDLRGRVDAELRAYLEAAHAKLAAPGMCNPDDQTPCVDADPTAEQSARDNRTPAQRHHDALKTLYRAMLCSGHLGRHKGLPVTVIVTTTLQELHSAAGPALTAGGSLLPMRDVIRLARHAHHYLAVFDKHTNQPLYLGRSKRLASPAQRLVLYARDRGCTRPGCTTPAYWCEVHHLTDWAAGGPTDITELTLACGPDNRLASNTDWTTRKTANGHTEWIPPPPLDTGQPRTNTYHHPQHYLHPDKDTRNDPDTQNDPDNQNDPDP